MTNTLVCPECGAPMVLKSSKFGKFWGCSEWSVTRCKGSVSAHQATGEPMGTPARQEVKEARKRAHRAFDELWTSGRMSRKHAYQWMQKVMKLSKREAHIANFGLAQCQQLIDELSRLK